jgi:hypothetical protein
VEQKDGWQLAEVKGDTTPYGLEHLFGRVFSDTDAVCDELQRYVSDHERFMRERD